MSQYSIRLKLPKYLGDWLRHEFWDYGTERVIFPKGSAEHTVLGLFVGKCPVHGPVAVADDNSDGVPIAIPTFPGKNPDTYNYLTPVGENALKSTIKRRFRYMLWSELHVVFNANVQITDIIYAFMEKHGISDDEKNWETIRQMYARMRKAYPVS